jgi:hypothetical protein
MTLSLYQVEPVVVETQPKKRPLGGIADPIVLDTYSMTVCCELRCEEFARHSRARTRYDVGGHQIDARGATRNE